MALLRTRVRVDAKPCLHVDDQRLRSRLTNKEPRFWIEATKFSLDIIEFANPFFTPFAVFGDEPRRVISKSLRHASAQK